MDHLIQIPQVDTAWQPIPEPWVTLGLVAGLDTELTLGTLCTPVRLPPGRHHGEGGGDARRSLRRTGVPRRRRRLVGAGARGVRLGLPARRERFDLLETTIETCRALWATGTKAYDGDRVSLPGDDVLPTPGPRHPDHRRGRRRAPDPGDRGPARRRLQPALGPRGPQRQAGRARPAPRRRPDARGTTSRSPCSTCPWSVETARTRGRRSSACAGGRRRRPSRAVPTRAPSTSTASATPSWPTLGVSTVFVGVRGLVGPTTCSPSPGSPADLSSAGRAERRDLRPPRCRRAVRRGP